MLTLWTLNPNGQRAVIDTIFEKDLEAKLEFWRPVFPEDKYAIYVDEFELNELA